MKINKATLIGILLSAVCVASAGPALISIPHVNPSGPPWESLSRVGDWNTEGHIVVGRSNWTGPADLGGVARMGWDARNLYLQADVVDDHERQLDHGRDLLGSDSVTLLLNLRPDSSQPPDPIDKPGQFKITFSPGFLGTDVEDVLSKTPTSFYIFNPRGGRKEEEHAGITVTSQKTDKGYLLRATVPWAFLGVEPGDGMRLDFDVCVSDRDSWMSQLQSLASLVPDRPFIWSTGRLLGAQLKGGATTMPARAETEAAAKQNDAATAEKHTLLNVLPPHRLTAPDAHLTAGGAIQFEAKDQTYTIRSQFSLPDSKWVILQGEKGSGWTTVKQDSPTHLQGTAGPFALDRQIRKAGECLEIHDKLTNLTDQNQPVMVRHWMDVPQGRLAALRLNGEPIPSMEGITSNPSNPTIFLKDQSGAAVGLIPFDGPFRLHNQTFCLNGNAGLADSDLVLAPHATYEQVWQIYLAPSGSYWDMVNAVRRQWGSNFKIEGPLAFVGVRPVLQGKYDVERMKQWLDARNVGVAAIGQYDPETKGDIFQGLANTLEEKYVTYVRRLVDVIHKARPGLPVLRYYHCYLTNTPYAKEADAADAMMGANGHPVVYSSNMSLFIPTDTNRYGRQMTQLAKDLVHKLGLDGLYWDEPQYSAWMYDYGKTWDGVSGVIDRNSHGLVRTRSLVPLITAKFRHDVMDWLAANHLTLVCNTEPFTPQEAAYKVHRFVEVAYWSLYDTNLFSPIGLGDPAVERTSEDKLKSQMRFLDYGALYDYYGVWTGVDRPGLCGWMYPITPIALGPGFIVARERILTNRSGRFSWGDKKLPPVEVHVIDATGREVKADWKIVSDDGIEWVQISLPPDHAAAIVR